MNLIDQMMNANEAMEAPVANAPVVNNVVDNARRLGTDHSFAKGDKITAAGLKHIQSQVVGGFDGYRGNGADVSEAGNNVERIRELANLNWNPVKVQACAVSKSGGVVEVPNQFFLFKGGPAITEPEPLPVPSVTEAYVPHTNSQLLGMMSGFAEDAELMITRVGQLDGGSRIFAVANSTVTEDVCVGDTFAMRILLQSGHGNGVATKVSAQAFRLLCNNGALVTVAAGRVSVRHTTGLTSLRIESAREIVLKASAAFHEYMKRMKTFYDTPATPAIIRLALAQYLLNDDKDWATVVRNVAGQMTAEVQSEQRWVGANVIERILEAEASRPVVRRMFAGIKSARLLSAVVEATEHQMGAAANKNTLGHAHNGLTYYSTHVRGRNPESALKSNLDRDDARGFAGLLEAQYVPAIRQVMGAGRVAMPALARR